MSQDFRYPQSATITATVAAVGPNNQPIPTQSILIAGENPSLNLQPLQTDASGNLMVNVAAGSITAENPSVSLTAGLVPTYATYVGMNVAGNLVGLTGTASGLKVDGSAVTQPISAASLPLPALASTSTKQSDGSQKTQIVDGSGNVIASTSNALNVNVSNPSSSILIGGKASINHVRNDYTSVNVTTSAYVQLIASTAGAISEIYIFDSSGQTLVLATGAPASEVDQIYIVPGGNGTVPLAIAASTRVSVKAVSATANVGELDINFLG